MVSEQVSEHSDNLTHIVQWSVNKSVNKPVNILTILHPLYNGHEQIREHSEIFIPCTIVSEQPCNPKSIILCALSASLHRM